MCRFFLTNGTSIFFHKFLCLNKMVISCLFMILILFGCWEKQDHEITAPQIPYYHFEGNVKDIDLGEELDSIFVNIYAIQLLESPSFRPKTTITDVNGNFAFDSIYVGTYDLIFYRSGYPVLTKSYFQNYNDTTLSFYLSDVYYIGAAQTLQAYTEFQKFAPSKFSFHPTRGYLLILNQSGIHRFKWESSLQQWIFLNSYQIPLEKYKIYNLNIAFGKDATYFYLAQKPDLLHKILMNINYLEIEQSVNLTHYVWDVYYLNDSLYIPSEDQLYVYDEKTFSLQRSATISRQDINISCFYRDKLYFWAADNISGRIYQCDKNLNILKSYVPFTKEGKLVINEMSIDFENKVWFR